MKKPVIHSGAFIAPDTAIYGDVTIEEGCSVWFHATVRGERAPVYIGAGALVTQNTIIPDGSLVIGSPAKVVRKVTAEEVASNLANAGHYVEEGREYARMLKESHDE